jgi:hypothetical protein
MRLAIVGILMGILILSCLAGPAAVLAEESPQPCYLLLVAWIEKTEDGDTPKMHLRWATETYLAKDNRHSLEKWPFIMQKLIDRHNVHTTTISDVMSGKPEQCSNPPPSPNKP